MSFNKNTNSQINREDWYLLIILIMIASAIIVKSYFNTDGYLSPDSTNYLKCAQNLLDGKGYYVSAYGVTGQDREFFAIWTAGYPTLIYLAAKLTGFSVFWASKILNIILIGVIFGVFRSLFKKNAYIYGLILLFSSYIEIFSYTWSETIFITALIWFSTSIYLFILNPKKITLLYLAIIMSSLMLFMSRYIGAFSFGLIGVLGVYYGAVRKDKSKSIILIGIAAINIGIMVVYLYHNYIETGFPTGMQRIPSTETNMQLFIMLIKALLAEILIPFQYMSKKGIIVQLSIFCFLLWKYRNNILGINNDSNNQPVILSFVFGIIGLVYLFSIILMRWMTQFDAYGYRLLAPGSILIFVAIIYFLQQRASIQFFNAAKVVLVLFSMLSFIRSVPYSLWHSYLNSQTYFQTIQSLGKKYTDIEKDSIIIFGSNHINYIFTDMQVRKPYYLPQYKNKEKWSDFMTRIDPDNKKNLYISSPNNELSIDRYDQTVIDSIKEYDKSTLVKVR